MLEVQESLTSPAARGTNGNYTIAELNKGDRTQTRIHVLRLYPGSPVTAFLGSSLSVFISVVRHPSFL